MQTRFNSAVEIVVNCMIGFVVAMATAAIAFPLFGFNATAGQNFWITVIFTVVSVIRSYIVRRIFNRITHRKLLNDTRYQNSSSD